MSIDSKGTIWVSVSDPESVTQGGLLKFENGDVTVFSAIEGWRYSGGMSDMTGIQTSQFGENEANQNQFSSPEGAKAKGKTKDYDVKDMIDGDYAPYCQTASKKEGILKVSLVNKEFVDKIMFRVEILWDY